MSALWSRIVRNWRRAATAARASQARATEREIGKFLAANGGRFTDQVEREIEMRFMHGANSWQMVPWENEHRPRATRPRA